MLQNELWTLRASCMARVISPRYFEKASSRMECDVEYYAFFAHSPEIDDQLMSNCLCHAPERPDRRLRPAALKPGNVALIGMQPFR
jgi:hypothetical protein